MGRQIIHDTFSLEIPENFESMSEADLRELSRKGGDPYRWGVRDRENHRMIVVLWKQYPALLSWLADLKSIAKKNEQLTGKAYAGSDYRLLEFISMQAGEEKAEGYRFSYTVEGISQVISCLLIKDGKTVYAFVCGGREENAAGDRELFRRILETLEYV